MNIKEFFDKFEKIRGWKKENFERLEIVMSLSSPLCLTSPWLSFDSLIDYLLFAAVLKEKKFIMDKDAQQSDYELLLGENFKPYAIIKQNGFKISKTSVSILDNKHYKIEYITKRFEERFANFKSKIRVGSGKFKSFRISHIYIPTKTVRFYVEGDGEFLEKLLKENLYAIGSEYRIGYGFIEKIKVKPTNKHPIFQDGTALRPIPVEFCKNYDEAVPMTYKPPYWKVNEATLCVPPFAKCTLRSDLDG